METFWKILLVVGCILIAPAVFAMFFLFIAFFILLLIVAMIWWIISFMSGTPIQVTENGKRVGRLIRGKYFPD